MTDPTAPDPAPSLPPRPPSSWRYRAGVTAALLAAAAALFLGIRATDTDDPSPTLNGRPDVVERVVPRQGAEVLRQVEIGIDLAAGYEAGLILNGTAIPTDELRLVPEQNQVWFAPGPGRTFETLPTGQSCVTAVVHKSADGPGDRDLTFQWCFDVT